MGGGAHPSLQPGRFTELFFLDEATAFAAGHRPCALCRREDYVRFGELWRRHHPGQSGADAIDLQLHRERVDERTRGQRHHDASFDELPDGAFVVCDGTAWLVVGRELLALDSGRLHGAVGAPVDGRSRDHAALAADHPPRGLGARRAAAPSLRRLRSFRHLPPA